ncbi:manganese efflux pump MntP [Candidatus Woesearchaeota archaeon]|jgi:putative Mn2+ efflux pump MntP|nr:manganese efflux pump MntP [Candidatus Woesearchaeota archaeon]|tara:strand:- start:57 stop:602 length:546 start_codon:yes stop_codon:yes gene_type:complete
MVDITIYLIALSLAIDCFIVSICISSVSNLGNKINLKIPLHFALFQGGMTLIGFYLGLSSLKIIQNVDHWIAFGLLFFVGIKMIVESFKKDKKINTLTYPTIILLSIATSIDALAIGVTFSIINGAIMMKALIIGLFSLILSLIGLSFGKRLKEFKLSYLEITGGLVLIGIGIKVLLQHIA